MWIKRPVFDLLTIFLLACTTQSRLVNVTIDDTHGDSITGQVPLYLPNGPWGDQSCIGCAITPNGSLAFDGTWHAVTYHPFLNNVNITLSFTGVSVWVFFILANNAGTGVTANTQCNFTLDGVLTNNFTHLPDASTTNLQYNVTAYTAANLRNSTHQLVISTNDFPDSAYLNFDYAIYTMDIPDVATSSHSTSIRSSSTGGVVGASHTAGSAKTHYLSTQNKLGIAIGCALGSIALAILAIWILFRRFWGRQEQDWSIEPVVATFSQQPPRVYPDSVTMSNPHPPEQASSIYGLNPSLRASSDMVGGSVPLTPVRQDFRPLHPRVTKGRDEHYASRQMEMDWRFPGAQGEMDNFTSRQTASMLRSEPGSSTTDVRRQGMELEMETLREELHHIRTQMQNLQARRSSEALADEPPPAYT